MAESLSKPVFNPPAVSQTIFFPLTKRRLPVSREVCFETVSRIVKTFRPSKSSQRTTSSSSRFRNSSRCSDTLFVGGFASGGGRTHNLCLRRATLYPVELRMRQVRTIGSVGKPVKPDSGLIGAVGWRGSLAATHDRVEHDSDRYVAHHHSQFSRRAVRR
jgi:hypothetical protein